MMGCCNFTCENHKSDGQKFVISTIFNVFFNNKRKISTTPVRKDVPPSRSKKEKQLLIDIL